MSMDDYKDLNNTGYETYEQIAPEDEMFHAVYISGKTRKNHIGVTENTGKLQVRGFQYNQDKIHMVITHVKQILVKNVEEKCKCFSFQSGKIPYKGTSGKTCGNSAERAADDFCNLCRAQIIVSGMLCTETGQPVFNDDKKPVFIFIRGKGTKYSNISEHLNTMGKMDLEPVIDPVTDESKRFEKSVVNNKRFVTVITITTAPSKYGDVAVFALNVGEAITKESVIAVLKISKKTLKEFTEKFDWSLKPQRGMSTYVPEDNMIPETTNTTNTATKQEEIPEFETPKEEDKSQEPKIGFDDISF